MKTRKKIVSIYAAGPLGFSEVGREFYYKKLLPLFRRLGFKVLDPWKLTDQKKIDRVLAMPYGLERRRAWQALNPEIAENNRAAIIEGDIVVAVLDGTDVDSGTAAEIGYAFAKAKKIYGYRGDFRLAADNDGCMVNLQVEYFIFASGGAIASSLKELGSALKGEMARRKMFDGHSLDIGAHSKRRTKKKKK